MLERLQKIIARAGIASRRHAEELIRGGQVRVNGVVVTELGAKADPERDRVEAAGRVAERPAEPGYYLLHKPSHVVATMSDPEGRATLRHVLRGLAGGVFPVGRLDYAASGLILLTTDGALADRILKNSARMPKVYWLKVAGRLTDDEMRQVGQKAQARLRRLRAPGAAASHSANPWYEAELTDARGDSLRQALFAIDHPVEKIKRVKLGPLELGDLAEGHYRSLDPHEVAQLRRMVEQASGNAPAAAQTKGVAFAGQAKRAAPAWQPKRRTWQAKRAAGAWQKKSAAGAGEMETGEPAWQNKSGANAGQSRSAATPWQTKSAAGGGQMKTAAPPWQKKSAAGAGETKTGEPAWQEKSAASSGQTRSASTPWQARSGGKAGQSKTAAPPWQKKSAVGAGETKAGAPAWPNKRGVPAWQGKNARAAGQSRSASTPWQKDSGGNARQSKSGAPPWQKKSAAGAWQGKSGASAGQKRTGASAWHPKAGARKEYRRGPSGTPDQGGHAREGHGGRERHHGHDARNGRNGGNKNPRHPAR